MRTWSILILLLCLCGSSGCTKKPPAVVVVPDSRVLEPGPRPGTHVITDGYLREILQELEACGRSVYR